jgi:hypothetical protein
MKTLSLVCLFLLLFFFIFGASAPGLCAQDFTFQTQAVAQDSRSVPPMAQATATDILRSFQTYYLKIDTIFLERPVIASALENRPEFHAWGLIRTENPGVADVIMVFTLPALTWQWNYKLTHGHTGQVLGFGRVPALEEYEASELLAQDIVTTIHIARGIPAPVASPSTSPGVAPLGSRYWNVKGGGHPIPEGRSATLSIARDSIVVSGAEITPFSIPTKNLLYAYHMQLQNVQGKREIEEWEKGWDQACAATSGDDGCLALLGLPLYLIGELILRTSDYGPSDYVILRIQDGQAISEMSFLTSSSEWPGLIADLQSVMPDKEQHEVVEAKELRKSFDAAKENAVQILLQVPVDVGRWPTLEPGDYKLIINEHGQGRADVFFYKLPAVDFTKPRAVAAAHASKLSPPSPISKVTFLEKGSLRFLDEVRVGGYLLLFD